MTFSLHDFQHQTHRSAAKKTPDLPHEIETGRSEAHASSEKRAAD